jgi:hypothetical protein
MGTNYTVYLSNEDVTQDPEALHIGKSSAGWVFSLRVYPDRGIRNLYDWMPIILNSDNVIRDEYGRHITAHEMLKTITVRSRAEPVQWNVSDWSLNQAEPGPNNLVRGREFREYGRTRTHGEGTWDYCDYEFC